MPISGGRLFNHSVTASIPPVDAPMAAKLAGRFSEPVFARAHLARHAGDSCGALLLF
jgi:hypothetical protein